MNINSDYGTFRITFNYDEGVSITESVSLHSDNQNDTNKIILMCPDGSLRKYNQNSPLLIIEDLVKNPPNNIKKHIYDVSLLNKEFCHFYCTSIKDNEDLPDIVYHGILIDKNGISHPCYIPSCVYKQIPNFFKTVGNHPCNYFKFNNFGTIVLD